MIRCAAKGYGKMVVEVREINQLGSGTE